MPFWNLRDDYPEFMARLVSEPLQYDDGGNQIPKDNYTLIIEEHSTTKVKTLIIDIQSSTDVPILSMLPGNISCNGNMTILTTDIFSIAGMNRIFSEESLFPELEFPSNRYYIRWFDSWIETGRIPKKIIYENIVDRICSDSDQNVSAGDVIGHAGSHPSNSTKKQIKIKIEYQDSADTDPKFMHPREFFSLLFWREECDPVFPNPIAPDPLVGPEYAFPLLQKMMRVYDNGNPVVNGPGEPVENIEDILNNVSDANSWLGLRPPLRTYKRLEWEARIAHILHHFNWQRLPTDSGEAARLRGAHGADYGNIANLKRNPLIVLNPYTHASKCNIFAGEMAFRAGFRVFVYITGSGLVYFTGNILVRPCTSASDDGEKILSRLSSATIGYRTKTYRIGNNIPRGKKRFVTSSNADQIYNEINLEGKAIIHTRKAYCRARSGSGHASYTSGRCPGGVCPPSISCGPEDSSTHRHQAFHIVFLSMLLSVFPNNIEATIIDQHNSPPHETVCFARDSTIADVGCKDSSERAFIELIPGGDPTEEWGVIDLNCLEEVVP